MGIKAVLSEMGLINNYLRLPLVPATEGLLAKINLRWKKYSKKYFNIFGSLKSYFTIFAITKRNQQGF